MHEARLERGILTNEEKEALPSVRVLLVDSRHIIATISTIRLEEDDAHAWLVAAGAVLRALDQVLPIDDIQGIPWRFWRLIVGTREAPL